MTLVGKTFAVTLIPAHSEGGRRVTLSGLIDVVDHQPRDMSAGIRDDYFDVLWHRDHDWYTVDTDDLQQQVQPDVWAQILVQEREMEFGAEEAARAEESMA